MGCRALWSLLSHKVPTCKPCSHPLTTVWPLTLLQIAAQLWNFPDRKDTWTGSVINEYLAGSKDLNDQAVHLLFSANRHEKRSARLQLQLAAVWTAIFRPLQSVDFKQ